MLRYLLSQRIPGLLPHVYDGLPWHWQRMYRELLAEELESEQEAREEAESGRSSSAGNSTVRAQAHGDLAGTGFQVRHVPASPGQSTS